MGGPQLLLLISPYQRAVLFLNIYVLCAFMHWSGHILRLSPSTHHCIRLTFYLKEPFFLLRVLRLPLGDPNIIINNNNNSSNKHPLHQPLSINLPWRKEIILRALAQP
jgi:hypothetical protein